MKRKSRFGCILLLCLLAGGCFLAWNYKKLESAYENTDDSYETLCQNPVFEQQVLVTGLDPVKQEVASTNACIEMLGNWQNKKITEEMVYELKDGKSIYSIGNAYEKIMNEQFGDYRTERLSNLKNSELLFWMYKSLSEHVPVTAVICQRDCLNDKYEPHFVLVTRMDTERKRIETMDPNGYNKFYTFNDFLKAARFENTASSSLETKIGLATGFLLKNTIYIMEKK